MAYPICGPLEAFWSATAPYASGTVSFLNPADDTDKTYYPTADDADAGTNGATGDLTLDSRGALPSQAWGADGEKYKVVLKDSSGATIETVDDLPTPTFYPTLWAKTPQTLTDAGAITLTEGTTHLVTTTASTMTLADATQEGLEKFLVFKTDAGDATVTPTTLANGTSIVFRDVGQTAHLRWTNSAWNIIHSTAHVTDHAPTTLEQFKQKTADTARATATLSADDHLTSFDIESGTVTEVYYALEALLIVSADAATADFDIHLSGTGAFNALLSLADTAGNSAFDVANLNTEYTVDLTTTNTHTLGIVGTISSTAAATTIDLEWARNHASSGTTTLHEGSWMKLTKINHNG